MQKYQNIFTTFDSQISTVSAIKDPTIRKTHQKPPTTDTRFSIAFDESSIDQDDANSYPQPRLINRFVNTQSGQSALDELS
jgi:hypothetical protein